MTPGALHTQSPYGATAGDGGCQLQSTLWNCWCWELCNFMISKYSENLQMSIWGISGHENTGSVPAAGFFWVAKCWGAVAAHLFTYLLSHQSVCYLAGDLVSEAADSVWCVLAVRWTTFDSTPNIKHTHTPWQSILTDNPGSCKKGHSNSTCLWPSFQGQSSWQAWQKNVQKAQRQLQWNFHCSGGHSFCYTA